MANSRTLGSGLATLHCLTLNVHLVTRSYAKTQSGEVAKPANFTTEPGYNNREKGGLQCYYTSFSSLPLLRTHAPQCSYRERMQPWAKRHGFGAGVKHHTALEVAAGCLGEGS